MRALRDLVTWGMRYLGAINVRAGQLANTEQRRVEERMVRMFVARALATLPR